MTIHRRQLLAGLAAGTAAFALAASARAAPTVRLSATEWRRRLGPERFHILREAGTERAFTSPLLKEKRRGTYRCAGCAQPLFASTAKYDSRTGWPSFWKALPRAVGYRRDSSLLMERVEEHCARCGGHLGHLFDDGPPPTGKRHCINGLSLNFRAA